MSTHVETVIVGGGQAGLAASYYLSRQDRPHIVLERASQAANAWRNHRWDSFALNTPNWQSWLPGAEIPGNDPDGFLTRDEIVAYFEEYVERLHLPVRYVCTSIPSRRTSRAEDILSKPALDALKPKISWSRPVCISGPRLLRSAQTFRLRSNKSTPTNTETRSHCPLVQS